MARSVSTYIGWRGAVVHHMHACCVKTRLVGASAFEGQGPRHSSGRCVCGGGWERMGASDAACIIPACMRLYHDACAVPMACMLSGSRPRHDDVHMARRMRGRSVSACKLQVRQQPAP